MGPAIACLIWLDQRAHKQGNVEEVKMDAHVEVEAANLPLVKRAIQIFNELDTTGLLLLGFGWSLVHPVSAICISSGSLD